MKNRYKKTVSIKKAMNDHKLLMINIKLKKLKLKPINTN
jgi:hypothetical protein